MLTDLMRASPQLATIPCSYSTIPSINHQSLDSLKCKPRASASAGHFMTQPSCSLPSEATRYYFSNADASHLSSFLSPPSRPLLPTHPIIQPHPFASNHGWGESIHQRSAIRCSLNPSPSRNASEELSGRGTPTGPKTQPILHLACSVHHRLLHSSVWRAPCVRCSTVWLANPSSRCVNPVYDLHSHKQADKAAQPAPAPVE